MCQHNVETCMLYKSSVYSAVFQCFIYTISNILIFQHPISLSRSGKTYCLTHKFADIAMYRIWSRGTPTWIFTDDFLTQISVIYYINRVQKFRIRNSLRNTFLSDALCVWVWPSSIWKINQSSLLCCQCEYRCIWIFSKTRRPPSFY